MKRFGGGTDLRIDMTPNNECGVKPRRESAAGGKDTQILSEMKRESELFDTRKSSSMKLDSTRGSRSLGRSTSELIYQKSLHLESLLYRTGEQPRSAEGTPLSSSKRTSTSRSCPRRIWHALPSWVLEYEALTLIQQRVMEHVAATSEVESAAAKDRLKRAWKVFNISEDDFSAIELYLSKKVPLTIRVDIQNLFPYLLQDPFYSLGSYRLDYAPFPATVRDYLRTAFETMNKGTAYLQSRREFERYLFDGLYEDPSVLPQDRPKYGVLNMVCNPFSDTRVSSFGSAYLLLKDSLRNLCCELALRDSARTTVATSKENLGSYIRRVGTLDNLWHVIETLSPHEITRIHAVATGRRAKATVSPDCKYSEIQVHGMLDTRKDVAAIVVQRQDLKCPARGPLIKDLSKLYLIPVLTCEELDELLDDRRWSTVVNQRANILLQKTMAMNDATFHTSSIW